MKKYAGRRAALLEELDGLRVDIDTANRIGTLVIERPPLNIVSYRARSQISAILEQFGEDEDVGVVVIRGAGGVYTSGGDVRGFFDVPRDGMSHLAWNIAAPERCPKPVIAALEQHAFGVGFELALACDFRFATRGTRMGLPEVGIGEIPGSGGVPRLIAIAGATVAKRMVFLAERVDAETALQWGILTEIAEDSAALDTMILSYARRLNAMSPLALRTAKRVANTAMHSSLSAGLEVEGHAYEKLRDSHDYHEGAQAFFEKRKPNYTGE